MSKCNSRTNKKAKIQPFSNNDEELTHRIPCLQSFYLGPRSIGWTNNPNDYLKTPQTPQLKHRTDSKI